MIHRDEIRVRYAETDRFGVVNNTHYIRWLEIGRTELLRELGMPLADIEKRGSYFLMAESNIRYLAPAEYDQLLVLETRIGHVGDTSLRFDYRILDRESAQVLAEAHTVHVCTDADGEPKPIPADLRAALREAMEE